MYDIITDLPHPVVFKSDYAIAPEQFILTEIGIYRVEARTPSDSKRGSRVLGVFLGDTATVKYSAEAVRMLRGWSCEKQHHYSYYSILFSRHFFVRLRPEYVKYLRVFNLDNSQTFAIGEASIGEEVLTTKGIGKVIDIEWRKERPCNLSTNLVKLSDRKTSLKSD
jgi:hypothetical protein